MKKLIFLTVAILFSSLSHADYDDGRRGWGGERHHSHHRRDYDYPQGYYQPAPIRYYQQPEVRYYPQPPVYYYPQPQVRYYEQPPQLNFNLRSRW
jgi:hypothetical protein